MRETVKVVSVIWVVFGRRHTYPFQNCRHVELVLPAAHSERDCQAELYNDEHQLNPERNPQDSVLTIVDAQSLILRAQEYCADNVPSNEQE
jgi:hypothetical protein